MDLQMLTLLLRARWTQLRSARDAGASSTDFAVITGASLAIAALVIVAVKTKVLEKIGIIGAG